MSPKVQSNFIIRNIFRHTINERALRVYFFLVLWCVFFFYFILFHFFFMANCGGGMPLECRTFPVGPEHRTPNVELQRFRTLRRVKVPWMMSQWVSLSVSSNSHGLKA